ncbi:MAG: chemotaxis protein CheW [Oscillospiraceae bacterium]|jgi:purine-binding chemotaxis protein CheW|nr:chemotaxis protein CheW [Oscillospiraceae bacterium]
MADTQNDALFMENEEDTMHGKYLVFELDGQEFAIGIRHVVDIINVQPITSVPACPDYVRGITNLRGKVIHIIDVRMRFGKTPQEYNDRTCIIVVADGDTSVGLIIDSVSEVLSLDDEFVSPPPSFSDYSGAGFIAGVGRAENGIKLILDYSSVLSDDRYVEPVGEFPA